MSELTKILMVKSEFITQLNITNGSQTSKIFWYKEQTGRNPGIRIGYYVKSLKGLHTSYYADGSYHNEIGRKRIIPHKKVPFSNITDNIQIDFRAFPVNSGLDFVSSQKISKKSPNKILTLSYHDYSKTMGISTHLVRSGTEGKFLNCISNVYCGVKSRHTLIGIELVSLNLFPDLKLGVVLLSENTIK